MTRKLQVLLAIFCLAPQGAYCAEATPRGSDIDVPKYLETHSVVELYDYATRNKLELTWGDRIGRAPIDPGRVPPTHWRRRIDRAVWAIHKVRPEELQHLLKSILFVAESQIASDNPLLVYEGSRAVKSTCMPIMARLVSRPADHRLVPLANLEAASKSLKIDHWREVMEKEIRAAMLARASRSKKRRIAAAATRHARSRPASKPATSRPRRRLPPILLRPFGGNGPTVGQVADRKHQTPGVLVCRYALAGGVDRSESFRSVIQRFAFLMRTRDVKPTSALAAWVSAREITQVTKWLTELCKAAGGVPRDKKEFVRLAKKARLSLPKSDMNDLDGSAWDTDRLWKHVESLRELNKMLNRGLPTAPGPKPVKE